MAGNVQKVSDRVSKYARDTDLSSRTLLDTDVFNMGLEVLSRDGFYAVLVASVPDAPNIVVKVCAPNDGYVAYALLCYNGCLTGPHYPVVYSATEVDGLWIFIIERLEPSLADPDIDETSEFYSDENEAVRNEIKQTMHADMSEYINSNDLCFDEHAGNWMLRGDQLVFIDPLCGALQLQFDENGVPMKLTGVQDDLQIRRSATDTSDYRV